MIKRIARLCTVFLLTGTALCFVSCKEKAPSSSMYLESIAEDARLLNEKCPIIQNNGAEVVSVECKDSQLVFTCKVSDQVISSINLDEASQQIVASVSDKMKEKLIKGKCNLIYKYVSDNDSSSITVEPNVLQEAYKKEHPDTK